MQKTASLNFCTPDNLFVESYRSRRCAVQKTASLNFCTPDNLFVESYSLEELIAMRRIRKRPPTHPDAILTSGVVIQEC